MYNLIVAMMSIALIALTGYTALFLGGGQFSRGAAGNTARAHAVTLVNNAQQVAGAQRVYGIQNAGAYAVSYEVLLEGGHLSAIPQLPVGAVTGGWSMSPDGRVGMIPLNIERPGQTGSPADRICEQMPVLGGTPFVAANGPLPTHDDISGSEAWFGCVTNPGATSVETATAVWFVHTN
ncbi:hypothetical protein IQ03_01196 [Gemmobacter caeni]|uniref:Uncharacterized protein n=1 Tax=Gemmobacter caeni TaxID=589035 RepID=A0A2T6B8Z1_9RHOB|nr:hypothetical protein [Gemmobacter caeni]PTX52551.1 hypothetical protein C8N34_102331 [Gemmobacter caeni]TWJ02778.1 hypothetical protein IQ03_01196 [Gemmobacter caeni]